MDDIIRGHQFANYGQMTVAINQMLDAEGWHEADPSRAAVHRVAQDLKGVLEQVRYTHEAARYLSEAYPDNSRVVSQASIRLIQDRLFKLSMDSMEGEKSLGAKELSAIARAMADLVRADIADSKYREEIKAKAELAATEVNATVRAAGLSEDVAAEIRAKILGIV